MTITEVGVETGQRISASDPVHGEIVDFLTDEAWLLDDDQHVEWLDRLTDDISYHMYKRKTMYRKDGRGVVPGGGFSGFSDNKTSLALRVRRNTEVPSAFDRDPAPRIRRLIGNIVVHETSIPGEYAVRSAILLLRNRFNQTDFDMVSASRADVIRRTPEGLKLASRTITPDQARRGSQFPNVFL